MQWAGVLDRKEKDVQMNIVVIRSSNDGRSDVAANEKEIFFSVFVFVIIGKSCMCCDSKKHQTEDERERHP